MKVGYVQFRPEFGEVSRNIEKSVQLISSANADLLVLPELCTTGYNFVSREELSGLAEELDGAAVTAWRRIAKEKKCHIVGGIAEKSKGDFYNSSVLVRPTGEVELFRKVHLFYRENQIFKAGDAFAVYDVGDAKVGMMICFDWAFPEAARSLALMGADIICHPSNLVLPLCQDAMLTRCVENRVFAITCNRYGTEDRGEEKLSFSGCSQIAGPDGKRLAYALNDGDEVAVIEIEPQKARDKKITPFNDVLSDRRVSAYVQ